MEVRDKIAAPHSPAGSKLRTPHQDIATHSPEVCHTVWSIRPDTIGQIVTAEGRYRTDMHMGAVLVGRGGSTYPKRRGHLNHAFAVVTRSQSRQAAEGRQLMAVQTGDADQEPRGKVTPGGQD